MEKQDPNILIKDLATNLDLLLFEVVHDVQALACIDLRIIKSCQDVLKKAKEYQACSPS